MRVQVGKCLPAAVGDSAELIVRLRPASDLARLFIFAREHGNDEFSPYIPGLAAKLGLDSGEPKMFSPLMMRVVGPGPRVLSFPVDIDGEFCVMQEIDRPGDSLARIKWKLRPNPALPLFSRLVRACQSNFLSR